MTLAGSEPQGSGPVGSFLPAPGPVAFPGIGIQYGVPAGTISVKRGRFGCMG